MGIISGLRWVFTPKNEAHSDLRNRLEAFITPRSNGEFAESRRLAYVHLQRTVLETKRARMETPASMCAIMFARYYTTHEILNDEQSGIELSDSLRQFMTSTEALPNEVFKRNLSRVCSDTLSTKEATIGSGDTYKACLRAALNDGVVDDILRAEEDIYRRISKGTHPQLTIKFNVHNRNTAEYCKRRLEKDIRRLEKVPRRLRAHFGHNKHVYTGLAGVVAVVTWVQARGPGSPRAH